MIWRRGTPLADARWVVIDVETSGLDAARDRLLSVGALGVAGGRIALEGALELRVRQETPSARDNIVIHGIGGDAQRAGRPLAEVTSALTRFVARAIPVGFHAAFDDAVLRRHGAALGKWLDLAVLLPAFFPARARREAALEDWLAAFGIPALERHDALGDAFATAQLLLVALAEAQRQRVASAEALLGLQRERRWL